MPRIYLVPATGGALRRATVGTLAGGESCLVSGWKAARVRIRARIRHADSPNAVLRVLTLETGKVTVVPGSQGAFFAPVVARRPLYRGAVVRFAPPRDLRHDDQYLGDVIAPQLHVSRMARLVQ